MKQPKVSDLKIDKKGTLAMRKKASATKKVKITINFDEDVLDKVRELAHSRGTPYQTLLNKMVRDSLSNAKSQESRLNKLERTVKDLKKKVG